MGAATEFCKTIRREKRCFHRNNGQMFLRSDVLYDVIIVA